MRWKARLKALERQWNETEEDSFRLVVSLVSQPANLANSSCRRTRSADGALLEIVRLDGSRKSLSDADLEAFIQSFPVECSHANPESSRS